jgi:hypothetical protein
MQYLIRVRPEPAGQFTAEAVGIPEARATATTGDLAIQQVKIMLNEWLASGELVEVEVSGENSLLKWIGWAKDDPLYQDYLDELARLKKEDLEQTLREYEKECSDSSSTPTT